jgi:hypothetical protein
MPLSINQLAELSTFHTTSKKSSTKIKPQISSNSSLNVTLSTNSNLIRIYCKLYLNPLFVNIIKLLFYLKKKCWLITLSVEANNFFKLKKNDKHLKTSIK